MNDLLETLRSLGSAEEFLDYFGVDYDPAQVRVKRLHILQRFHQYLRAERALQELNAQSARERCRVLLARAYADLASSDVRTQKLFKVLRDAAGVKTVSVDALRATRPA